MPSIERIPFTPHGDTFEPLTCPVRVYSAQHSAKELEHWEYLRDEGRAMELLALKRQREGRYYEPERQARHEDPVAYGKIGTYMSCNVVLMPGNGQCDFIVVSEYVIRTPVAKGSETFGDLLSRLADQFGQ